MTKDELLQEISDDIDNLIRAKKTDLIHEIEQEFAQYTLPTRTVESINKHVISLRDEVDKTNKRVDKMKNLAGDVSFVKRILQSLSKQFSADD